MVKYDLYFKLVGRNYKCSDKENKPREIKVIKNIEAEVLPVKGSLYKVIEEGRDTLGYNVEEVVQSLNIDSNGQSLTYQVYIRGPITKESK